MGVGYPLDGSVFARRNESSTYRGKFDYLTGFLKKLFFVYRGAHTESYAERVPHIKIVALVTVWCD